MPVEIGEVRFSQPQWQQWGSGEYIRVLLMVTSGEGSLVYKTITHYSSLI